MVIRRYNTQTGNVTQLVNERTEILQTWYRHTEHVGHR